MCRCSNLYYVYSNNYSNNYSFVIFICLQCFFKQNLFLILLTQLVTILLTTFFIGANAYSIDLYSEELQPMTATSHKADWITNDSCFALPCPFIIQHEQSNELSWSRRFAFSPFRELYRDHLYICILTLVCPFFLSSLLCLFYLDRVRCILFTSLVVCSLTFISCWRCWLFTCNKLVIVVPIAFAKLMLNDIRSFRFA